MCLYAESPRRVGEYIVNYLFGVVLSIFVKWLQEPVVCLYVVSPVLRVVAGVDDFDLIGVA